MDAVSVIQLLENTGFEMIVEGDKIRIYQGERLPDSIKENIIECKSQILEVLRRDLQAKHVGLMVGISGELYTVTINKCSFLFIECIDWRWEAWRETYNPNRLGTTSSTKILISGITFDYVLSKVKKYLKYIERMNKSTSKHSYFE